MYTHFIASPDLAGRGVGGGGGGQVGRVAAREGQRNTVDLASLSHSKDKV